MRITIKASFFGEVTKHAELVINNSAYLAINEVILQKQERTRIIFLENNRATKKDIHMQ